MSKLQSERNHKKRVNATNSKLSPEELYKQKCQRSAARNLARKQEAQEAAEERQKYWRGLSPIDQLAALDRRLGVGVGAKKQRAKIQAKIVA